MRPLLSLCIPTWNRADTLDDLLASIAAQGKANLSHCEVVVADNASTDGTLKLLRHWRRQLDCPLRVSRAWTNQGIDRNEHRAVSKARGDYVWLIGSDDEVVPGGLARVLDSIAQAPGAMILGQRITRNHEKTIGREERFVDCPDRTGFWFDTSEGIRAYLARALSPCAAFSFLSCTVLPRKAWPTDAEAKPWLGSYYLQTFAQWHAVLSHGTPLYVRQVPFVYCRVGNPQRRDMDSALHVQLDARTFRRLAGLMPTPESAEALRRILRHEYLPSRLPSLDARLERCEAWPFIRWQLTSTMGED